MLKLDNVTISYKNVPTVQNFNLDMKEGQIVSLVGESGSGKPLLSVLFWDFLQVAVRSQKEVLRLKEKTFYPIHRNSGENFVVLIFP